LRSALICIWHMSRCFGQLIYPPGGQAKHAMELMAAWRRLALEAFPELRQSLNELDYNIYTLFFDLLPAVRAAHEANDVERTRAIYGFAEWCFSQPNKQLWNSAGVAFYEHLFDGRENGWRHIVPWLSPRVRHGCLGLWEYRLRKDKLSALKLLLESVPFRSTNGDDTNHHE
jgi:hypothetical protein